MTKLGAALSPLLLLATATAALAQPAPEPAPAPAPAPAAPATAGQPVVVVSPGPVVVTQPAAAPAAPSAVPAAPAATVARPPQTHDWNDLNHINGQLVKVGETNDYVKTYRRTSISTNPVGWILGSYGVSVSYGLNNNIAIRGDVGYLDDYLEEGTTGFSAEVGLPIYLRRTYQGPFIEPGFAIKVLKDEDVVYYSGGSPSGSSTETSTETVAGPQVLAGWQWTWDSGFNLAVAAGVGRNWSSDDEFEKIFPNGYFRVGYAF